MASASKFQIAARSLKELVEKGLDSKSQEDVMRDVMPLLNAMGGTHGIAAELITNVDKGIDSSSTSTRTEHYGENRVPQPPAKSLLLLMWEALHDPILIVLMISAALSLALGVYECPSTGWIEGCAIIVAIVIVVMVSSVNDWQKERQFRALNAVKDDVLINVIRDGIQMQISTYNIVVGDIVELAVGDIVCADGILVVGNDVKINEGSLTGESDDLKKSPTYQFADNRIRSGPFIFSSTKVMEGAGRIIVVGVGANSYAGASTVLLQEDEGEDSVLQVKLNQMAAFIGKAGIVVAVATLIGLGIRFGVTFSSSPRAWDHSTDWIRILELVIVAVTVLVVAVPEGLPLAVTISLAFSVKRMLKDNNLVRHLDACETMGGATTICSDKTGTLTTNRMTVVKAFIAQVVYDRNAIPTISSSAPSNAVEALAHSIAFNSSARLEAPKNGLGAPEHVGNKTECALLGLCADMGVDYAVVRGSLSQEQREGMRVYTFSSLRKRMSTVVPLKSLLGGKSSMFWRVFSKGASEIMLDLCTTTLNSAGDITPLSASEKDRIKREVIDVFAEDGLRTICVAAKDVHEAADWDNPDAVEKDLQLLCIVGIEDPVRPEVPAAIEVCARAGIVVRMVTGDNITTAKSIARKCGILKPGDNFTAMEGPEFRKRVMDADGNIIQAEVDKIWPMLRVLARSSPKDKHTLVSGIKASTALPQRQVVAVTGDGTNDGPALKKADVGFAMGIAGTSVAKDAADIILMDDNFTSIVKAVKWGRCVYDNVCKFLQFQLTVNLVAITVAFLGAFILGESPLKAIHLLWINLIMDSLASLALATELPDDSLLLRKPYGRNKPLLSKAMIKFIVGHSVYQFAVIGVLVFAGDSLFGVISGRPADVKARQVVTTTKQTCAHDDPTAHYTIVFNTFVWMQIFNEVNSRKLHSETNVFKGFVRNAYFHGILLATIVLQIILIEVGGKAFETAPLTWPQWLICVAIGAGTWVVNFILSLLPHEWIPNGEGKPQGKSERDLSKHVTQGAALAKTPSQRPHASFRDRKMSRVRMVSTAPDEFDKDLQRLVDDVEEIPVAPVQRRVDAQDPTRLSYKQSKVVPSDAIPLS